MTIFNRFLMILGLFISFNLNAFCQEDDEEDVNDKIAEQLQQMFDDVDHFDDVFFAKQNGVWEFVNEYGKVLTNMRIENVECNYTYAELTIKGKKYTLENRLDNDKVLVGRYGYYAYMDKNGDIVTPFIYDGYGDKVDDQEEAVALYDTSEQIMNVCQEAEQGDYSSVKTLEKSLSLEQAGKLTSEVADSLLTLLCKTYEKRPKKVDMKMAEDLFAATLVNCGYGGNNVVLDYYANHGLDKQKRFDYVQQLADDYNSEYANLLMGDFQAKGALCTQDIQGAIGHYKNVMITGDEHIETAHDKLAELWKKYGTKYDNQLGKLCAENEKVVIYNDEYIILTNGTQNMVVDTLHQEVLPKGDYEFYGSIEGIFILGNESSGYQLVKKGGKPLIEGTFDDFSILAVDEDLQLVLKKDGKWGFYEINGTPITSMIFDDYDPGLGETSSFTLNEVYYSIHSLFKDGQMIVGKDGTYGCVNTEGKETVPFIYDNMVFTPKGNLVVLKDGKYGVIDKNGNQLLPCKYDLIEYDEEEGKLKAVVRESVDL